MTTDTASDTATIADPATGLTAADLRRAALTVCHYAVDAEEARTLLSALGLREALQPEALAS